MEYSNLTKFIFIIPIHSWFDVPDVQDEANFVDGVTIVSNLVIHSDGSYSKLNVSGELDSFSDGGV